MVIWAAMSATQVIAMTPERDCSSLDFDGPSQKQRGIALVSILLLLVFILTILSGLFYRHQIHIQKTTQSLMREQVLLLLLSAEGWAKKVLQTDALKNDSDHLDEIWAQVMPPMPIDGGVLQGCLIDMQGRFNLNSLAWYTNESWDSELNNEALQKNLTTRRNILLRLLKNQGLEATDQRVALLIDWLDADSWLTAADSAEDNEYLLQDPPYRSANHTFTDLSELTLVQGFSVSDVVALEPWVSVIPEDVSININTAPQSVLSALSTFIDDGVADRLMADRPFSDVDQFYRRLEVLTGKSRTVLKKQIAAEFIGISSHYFMFRSDIDFSGLKMTYHSVIRRQDNGPTQVLQRTLIPAPKRASMVADEDLNSHQVDHDSATNRFSSLCHQT